MKKIIVVGLGHGGLIAAIKLAEAGYNVTILEAKGRSSTGYLWADEMPFDIFEKVGIPAPEEDCYCQKPQGCLFPPDMERGLPLPHGDAMEEISVDRRGLLKHLVQLAESAGVTIQYHARVNSLVLDGWQVVGVKTALKKYKADLVIDASGFYSQIRGQVPSHFHMQAMPAVDDILTAYRAIYEKTPGTETPYPERHLYLSPRGEAGISWCNLNRYNHMDVLVSKIGDLTKEDVKHGLADLREHNETLSDVPALSGQYTKLSMSSTISRMVADGFALVGDSAFMAMPLRGNGIEAAMTAGKLLAETVIRAGNVERYSVESLWPYQVAYYKALGARSAFLDSLKKWALFLNPADLNWLFACAEVTPEQLLLLTTMSSRRLPFRPEELLNKLKLLCLRPDLIAGAGRAALRGLACYLVAQVIPTNYDAFLVDAWQSLYEGLIPHKKLKKK